MPPRKYLTEQERHDLVTTLSAQAEVLEPQYGITQIRTANPKLYTMGNYLRANPELEPRTAEHIKWVSAMYLGFIAARKAFSMEDRQMLDFLRSAAKEQFEAVEGMDENNIPRTLRKYLDDARKVHGDIDHQE